jgi:transitional endoplasmic reticulum ATPase
MANRAPGGGGAGSSDDIFQRLTDGLRRAAEGLGRQLGDQFPVLTETSNGAAKRVVRMVPDVTFADVGGCEEAKRELEGICAALATPDLYKRWGTRPPRGVLLYGPPGTGKTLLARCVAGQAQAEFIHIRAVDVASMWYGEAEKKMQNAFDEARRRAPAVLFLDEVDALTPPREMAHEATGRVVATLLENLDGLQPLEGVAVLAATNRPAAVDPAFTRPGRLDRLVHVGLPDAAARLQILLVHQRLASKLAERDLFAPSEYRRLLKATEGMSGAEIEELIRRVLEDKVRSGAVEGVIDEDDLLRVVDQFEWGRQGRARRPRRWWQWA